jgi:acyl-CoA hydrolase
MVAIDEEGKPVEIPALDISSEAEQAEWDAGKRRYELRRQRRVEGF